VALYRARGCEHHRDLLWRMIEVTERWKIEMTEALTQIAQTLPNLVDELERMNDRNGTESTENRKRKEESIDRINNSDN